MWVEDDEGLRETPGSSPQCRGWADGVHGYNVAITVFPCCLHAAVILIMIIGIAPMLKAVTMASSVCGFIIHLVDHNCTWRELLDQGHHEPCNLSLNR